MFAVFAAKRAPRFRYFASWPSLRSEDSTSWKDGGDSVHRGATNTESTTQHDFITLDMLVSLFNPSRACPSLAAMMQFQLSSAVTPGSHNRSQ